ncbi:MAG: hypothetical protein ACQEP4_02570 [Bacillota bacterium]
MKLVNEKVEHIKFGKGIIVEADKNNISVLFEDDEEKRLFQYPEAFGKFLEIKNPKLKKAIMKDYEASIEQQKMEVKRIEKERVKEKTRVKDEAVQPKKKPKKSKK